MFHAAYAQGSLLDHCRIEISLPRCDPLDCAIAILNFAFEKAVRAQYRFSMTVFANPFRREGLFFEKYDDVPFPSVDARRPSDLLAACPQAGATPLVHHAFLGAQAGIGALFVKDERRRMGLGSFKALGAAYAIAHAAAAVGEAGGIEQALAGRAFVTASAGNHGLSVAAGARVFGARAVIYLAETVPEVFGERLRAKGAQVRYAGADYEESMAAAARAAEAENLTLLSDSSWPGYIDLPHRLMEGYLVLAAEAARQIPQPPTHIFLQAGVGGMAAAVAAYAREIWGDRPSIVVVEPEAAPALLASIEKGEMRRVSGPVSNMGRLDCKEPSLIALKGLARDADFFMTVSDDEAETMRERAERTGLASTPSGVAGLAGLFSREGRDVLKLSARSVALAILSEGPQE